MSILSGHELLETEPYRNLGAIKAALNIWANSFHKDHSDPNAPMFSPMSSSYRAFLGIKDAVKYGVCDMENQEYFRTHGEYFW